VRKSFYRLHNLVIFLLLALSFSSFVSFGNRTLGRGLPVLYFPPDTTKTDTIHLRYPFGDEQTIPGSSDYSNMYMKNPSNMKVSVEYDPVTHEYVNVYQVGRLKYRIPTTLSYDEYQDESMQEILRKYWQERAETSSLNTNSGVIPKIHIGGKAFETIFGNNTVDIRPQGSAEISFGIISNRRDDPMLSTRQRRQTNFDFAEKIQMNVIAKIGDKIEFKVSYNSEATFDFENKLKLKYEGKEDEIIQLIEGGDVNMPLSSTLIRGSESLFGIKTKLRFGRTTVTAVYSQQKSETKNITVQGNAQTTKFNIKADEYEDNRHFFLAQYFRKNYKGALKTLPVVSSNINILKIEVWITNIGAAVTENRNIVAFMDLGENTPYNPLFTANGSYHTPSNKANNLLSVLLPNPGDTAYLRNINKVSQYLSGPPFFMTSGQDYEKVESARKLLATEYNFNRSLGFISLNTTLNADQVLGVAYQYTVIGDTTVYQVGEFSDQGIQSPNSLFVKLLKSTSLNTRIPLWNLMMKNVYSLGAYQVQGTDFNLNILYSGNKNGVPTAYITESRISGVPLLKVLNFDNLNQQGNPPADGMFDFIDAAATRGGTIQASNGRIYFTVLEPFGSDLRDSIYDPQNPQRSLELASKYCYDSLYSMTKTMARQYPDKNKFVLDGFYKSSAGSEISLNALNVPQGSVHVTAGGVTLQENIDYTVDYTLGRVRIINEGILNSGTPINISMESTQMFNIQTKRLMGAHIDYKFNKDFIIGGTVMNLNERPLTQKVNYGDEPISNTMWGLNLTYRTQSRLITKLVDALPLITTKAVSNVSVDAEFAQFIPGHSKTIGKAGTSYIDDFEGTRSTIDLKNVGSWFYSSTPQGQYTTGMFPEAAPGTNLAFRFNVAKLAYYIIDPLFYDRNQNLIPPNISNNELSNNAVRQVWETEVFPNKQPLNGVPVNLAVLNLAYYPSEVGPYNYDVQPTTSSKGINPDGTLADPQSRWGGITRKIETSDFDATNIQYIEFWMMDPFTADTSAGDLYFNLGDISEDVLRDGRKSYENGLPTSEVVTNVDTTLWGRVPNVQALVDAFDNNASSRPYQDVGYDGLRDADERSFFTVNYLDRISSLYGTASDAYRNAFNDPSSDDFHYFRGTDYDNDNYYSSILNRYKKFDNPDGNSPAPQNSPESYPTMATSLPNTEDINKDNTLSESERYYQYVVHLSPDKMRAGMNYITSVYHAMDIPLANGSRGNVYWYQFKIPIRTPDKTVGNITDFTSIRFLRMFFKGFSKPIVCRFATFELSRGEWRKYAYDLLQPGEYIPDDNENLTSFDISTVSIEENGTKTPIPYVMPPGVERETNWGSTNQQQLNEQSMVLKICNLIDGDARAAYKTCEFDFRQFKRLQMFVHAEKSIQSQTVKNGDLTLFIRVGSDFTQNYYEYEVPLTFTPWGTPSTRPDDIWPESNAFDVALDRMVQSKEDRNVAMRQPGNMISPETPFVEMDGKNKVTVLGSPTISDVKAIMIGIRNPKKTNASVDDDGQAKCAEIWVDELRLSDFNTQGGWAATARIAADLADLGRVQFTGSYSSSGFGSIDQKQTERQMESIASFGFDTDLELGKFFPQKSGVRIPVHFDYSYQKNTPKYDPLNPDVLFTDELATYDTKAQKDSVKMLSEAYTQRKNFNLMNVRKDRMGDKKPKVYDIENFNVSYAYSEIFHRDIDIQYDLKKKYTGGIGYNYSAMPKNIMPLSKVKFFSKRKTFKLLSDFNFYYLPRSFAFRTDMNREFEQRQYRNKSDAIVPMETFFIKKWDWTRTYDLKYDFSRSLKFTFTANANSYINEPPGMIDKSAESQIWDQIFSFGTMTNYNQLFGGTYDFPFSKIPILDWLQTTFGYQAGYHWTANPISLQSQFGNNIENSNTKTINGTINFVNLYNKVPYLKKINSGIPGTRNPNASQKGQPQKQNSKIDSLQKATAKFNFGKFLLDGTLRILMGVRRVGINYSQGNGTFFPGFYPEPDALGNNWTKNAPGLGFVFGDQQDIRSKARENEWITTDTLLNTAYMNKFNENLTANAVIEPLNDLKIELNAVRTYTSSHQEYYKADANGTFESYSPLDNGTFSMSYILIKTSFSPTGSDNTSPLFEKMKEYRIQIADRYAAENPWYSGKRDSLGYPEGYGPTDQEVLTSAFLAAYSGTNPGKIGLTAFPKFPLPNWRITYDGLMKIRSMKKLFRTFTLSHAYLSTYTVGSFNSNILYKEEDGFPKAIDDAGNYIPKAQISAISITEQFNPLIKFDMGWVNSLLTNLEWRRSRNLSLSFVNNQLTEVFSNEFIVGLGYRFKNVKLSFLSGGGTGGAAASKKGKYSSDIALKLDFSIRQNRTVLRRIDEEINQVSTGQQVTTIDFTADYNLSQRFNIRFYFNKVINSPYVSNQYRTSNTKGGITLRFTLAQ
jgi:cell surface protein SprA